MINSNNDNLLYNLSYLSSVIHPVIILRLLEHRLFTPLFKKKSATIIPPFTSHLNEHKTNITPNNGASALASIPTLPRPDILNQPRNSDKHRKISRGTPSTSISGVTTTSSQIATNNDSSIGIANPTDLSSLLTTNNSNQTTRKWFWLNSEKNVQSNISNDRNPLLQAIVENDTILSLGSVPTTATTSNGAGVGEIKLFEKELLNLPSFQLSDSQNPLLPSPTCLNYDFPAQFNQTITPTTNIIINRQYTNSLANGLHKTKYNDDDCK
jgi:hypothetical protein